MPQPQKTEKNIKEVIANLKGGVGVIRIAEIINKFAPTPDDRMAIFDYFYKVLDKEITVKEFAQNLLQKLSIKQEDRKRLIIEINQKIFRFLEDYLKKEIASALPQRETKEEVQTAPPGQEADSRQQTAAIARQVSRPEIPKPEMPKPVLPPAAPNPQMPRPETLKQEADSRQQTAAIARQVSRPEIPRKEFPATETPKREPLPFHKPSFGQDRYRESVPEEPRQASEKSEPKIQGNIVDLRNQ